MTLPFRLLVITDWSLGDRELMARLAEALAASSSIAVQHRNPGASGRQFFEQAAQVHDLCRETGTPLFINSRADIALELGAHLHLTSSSPRVGDVRAHLKPGQLISTVVHSAADLANANQADLALVSPVFAAGSKPDDTRAPLGVEGFVQLRDQLACPAFALGGITPGTAAQLRGAAGVAAISGILRSREVGRAVEAMLEALNEHSGLPS